MHAVEVSGTLAGHVYFGVLFTVWALWWIGEAILLPPAEGHAPLERGAALPVLKLVLPLIGTWLEIPNRGWDPDDYMMGWAHMAAYTPFALTGAVDLLARRGVVSGRAGFAAYALALLNAAFVFWGHDREHGTGVPSAAHLLLVVALSTAAASALFERARPGAAAGWFRRGILLGLGTWLLTLTWVLYRSGWDMADPVREGWVYVLFSWNAIIVSSVVATVAVIATRARDRGAP